MSPRTPAIPPITFDGFLHWYTEWFDPTDDRCSRCRGPIAEEEVPLILFKTVGRATWQARVCPGCMGQVLKHVE